MVKRNNLLNATVVVTGASSGIGRGTAVAFAKSGANLVLAARNLSTLNEVADDCLKFGVKVLVVPTDVTDSEQVAQLAEKAVNAFNNRIDVWINDPGVGAVGTYEEVPAASHAQVIATNLLGYMNGTHAVLPYMKKQNAGIIINMNSLGAFIPSPYAASYTASKFGLRGFSEAIKAEIRNFPEIHMCDVYASFVGSPGMQHGANYTGVEMKPVPPYVSAHRVADEIVSVAQNPTSTHMVGMTATLARIFGPHASGMISSVMAKAMEKHFETGTPTIITDGNLFKPSPKKTSTIEGKYGPKVKVINAAMTVGGFLLIGAALNKILLPKKTLN